MALSLLGLTFFLFLVATNTQSGWVYVIVACLTATLLLGYIIARLMLYKLTADTNDYNLVATIGILIFIISATFTLITFQRSGSMKNEEGFQ